MKYLKSILIVSLLTLLMFGCQNSEESHMIQQEEYASKINAKIDQIDTEINELKAQLSAQTDTLGEPTDSTITVMEVELEHRIATLEQEKHELSEKFQELWQANADEWENLKTEIDAKLANLQEYLDEEVAVSLK